MSDGGVLDRYLAVLSSGRHSGSPAAVIRASDWLEWQRSGVLEVSAQGEQGALVSFPRDEWKTRRMTGEVGDLRGMTESYRARLASAVGEPQVKAVKSLKAGLAPAVTWSWSAGVSPGVGGSPGTFAFAGLNTWPKRDAQSATHLNPYVCFDLDGIAAADAASVRDEVADVPGVLASGVSLGGGGVWAVLLIDRTPEDGPDDFRDVWWHVAVHLHVSGFRVEHSSRGGVDRAPSSPVSLRFAAWDPGLRINPAAAALPVPVAGETLPFEESMQACGFDVSQVPGRRAGGRREHDAGGAAHDAGGEAGDAGSAERDAGEAPSWLTSGAAGAAAGGAGGLPPADIAPEPQGVSEHGLVLPDDLSAHVDRVMSSGRWAYSVRHDERRVWLGMVMALKGLVLDGHLDNDDALARLDRWSAQSGGNYGAVVETWDSLRKPEYGYLRIFGVRAGGSGRGAQGADDGAGGAPPGGWSVSVANAVGFGGRAVGMVSISHSGVGGVDLDRAMDLRDLDEERRVVDAAMRRLGMPGDTQAVRAEAGRLSRLVGSAAAEAATNVGMPRELTLTAEPSEEPLATYSMCGIGCPVGGATVLYGQGGSAKSQIAMATAARMAAEGRRVLYLDTEPFADDFKRQQASLHVAASPDPQATLRNLSYRVLSGWNLHVVRSLLDAARGVDLIVFDSATQAVDDDINNSEAASRFYALLRVLDCGTALVLCHVSKSGAEADAAGTSPLGTQTWESGARLTVSAKEIRQAGPVVSDFDNRRRTELEVVKSNCATRRATTVIATTVFEPGRTTVSAGGVVHGAERDADRARQRITRAVDAAVAALHGLGSDGTPAGRFLARFRGGTEAEKLAAFMARPEVVSRPAERGVGRMLYHAEFAPQEGDGNGDDVHG